MTDLMPQLRSSLAVAAAADARRHRTSRVVPTVASAMMALAAALVLASMTGWPFANVDVVEKVEAALSPASSEIMHSMVTRTTQTGNHETTETVEQWEATDPIRGRIWVRPTMTTTGGVQTSYGKSYYQRTSGADGNRSVPTSGNPIAELKRLLATGELEDVGEVTVGGQTVVRLQGLIDSPAARQQLTYDVEPGSYRPLAVRSEITPRLSGQLQPDDVMVTTTRFRVMEMLPLNAQNEQLLHISAP